MQSPAQRPTMTQVAARAKVSVMTVSYTFNRPDRVAAPTREKVLRAAAELGYAGPNAAARSLRYGSTRTLGVVLGEHLTYAFDDSQAVAFLGGVSEVCADHGYGLLITPVTGVDDDARRVAAAAVDAFVVWTTTDDDPVLDAVIASGRPVVVHGGPARDGAALVSVDNRAAARAIGLEAFAGATRPAVLSFPLDQERRTVLAPGVDPDGVRFPVTRERLLGYRDAAEDLGLDWSSVLVGAAATNDDDEARTLAEQMLTLDPPLDAIAAMSDEQALGVLAAAAASAVPVPERLTVSGWDASRAAAAAGLSTVAQDLRAQGASCARIALGGPAEDHADRWSVVVRSSTVR
ncbi:LacI family DNA-binding transcriptional regulator [Sanguibacter suaedae]|uniref:LacI family DNA-binding transcriptional regulator n=1 Tax=Sanguibacter suaedae TaxID=2795737 RepID=A0A934I9E7_9MICO|nr:LacI family DNA-binding transcriptional regulator [Sanguibacter suaedae]MBI9113796.1 LacI family DNA-binding transcriptional regulator [Sanguibacter suaedae]